MKRILILASVLFLGTNAFALAESQAPKKHFLPILKVAPIQSADSTQIAVTVGIKEAQYGYQPIHVIAEANLSGVLKEWSPVSANLHAVYTNKEGPADIVWVSSADLSGKPGTPISETFNELHLFGDEFMATFVIKAPKKMSDEEVKALTKEIAVGRVLQIWDSYFGKEAEIEGD